MRASAPPSPVPTVPLNDYLRLEKERDRFRKMYEHQKQLVEVAMKKHDEQYEKIQEKITENIALSSRLEESKRFIRQIKREIANYRQRDLPYHNQKLEDGKIEAAVQKKFVNIIRQQQVQFEDQLHFLEQKMDSQRSLVSHLSILAGMDQHQSETYIQNFFSQLNTNSQYQGDDESRSPAPVCVSLPEAPWSAKKLDTLLEDAYYEFTAVSNELQKARRQHEAEVTKRVTLEREFDGLRKQLRDSEVTFSNERRRMMLADEGRADVHARLQTEVLELRRAFADLEDQNQVLATRCGSRSRSSPYEGQSTDDEMTTDSEEGCFEVHVDPEPEFEP